MTQADSARALRRSLDSESTTCGQGQAAKMTDPLPDGWTHFYSKADPSRGLLGRWYATAPWPAHKVSPSKNPWDGTTLAQTVDAVTWPALHQEVAEQVSLHHRLTGGE